MDKTGTELKPIKVGVLPLDGFALMAYSCTVEPFRASNVLSGRHLYDVLNLGWSLSPVSSSGAATVSPQFVIHDSPSLDYLFVVAGGNPLNFSDKGIFSWLGRISRFGTKLGGVSGGPVILAKAGLMNGRRMTVHWEHAEALSEIFPDLMIERTLYVIDRDRFTCAGGTAALDMMLELVTQQNGNKFANLVSDWFLHTEIRPSVGPQRSGLAARVGSQNSLVLSAVRVMENHIADPISLEEIASQIKITSRQLNRLFKQHLNHSTMRYYRDLRLEKAKNLLINSPLRLVEIALATGFSNPSHFSRIFSEVFGRSPSNFR